MSHPYLPTDLDISQKAILKPIQEIAASIGIDEDDLELYGKYKAKINLDVLQKLPERGHAKLVDVTAITPTPLGEGKTVTTIGLSQGLARIGKSVMTCIRQPSLGPVFGIKGGAAGGGHSQVVPMEDFNLHLTGDVHAVGLAHNLCAAFLDNSLYKGNPLRIHPLAVHWRRVMDVSDRALRNIVVGLGGSQDGLPRQTGFDITVASEVMAILALSRDLKDLRERLGRIVVAENDQGDPVTAEDLEVAGAMTVLLMDAIKPTLMQTLEHTPCLVHAGPFANIAHGNSSILADMIGMRCADFVVTESGFGADCGAEKFMNVKCRYSGLQPSAVVLVCTVRALKMHSGRFHVVAGQPLDQRLLSEDTGAVDEGCANLIKQIENLSFFGVPVVVVINRFSTDTEDEIALIQQKAMAAGAFDAVQSNAWALGGQGATDLAQAVVAASEQPSQFRFLYPLEASIQDKINTIATKIYGASDVFYSLESRRQIQTFTSRGYGRFPICMAKTHLSLSHDPILKGAPKGFTLPIKEIRASVGAGFLYALCGEIRTMPGLPSVPAGTRIDIDDSGRAVGLF